MDVSKKDILLAEKILNEAGFKFEIRKSVQNNRISIKNLDDSIRFKYIDTNRIVNLKEFCKNGVYPLNVAFIK